MAAYDQDLVDLFRSERLVYRAVDESSEADKKFMLALQGDPVNAAMSGIQPVKPPTKASVQKLMEGAQTAPLFVLACIPRAGPAGEKEEEKEEGKETDKADGEPRPIGFVTLFNPFGGGGPLTHHRCAMLGISIHTPFRGRGYGGEMIDWALDWGFRRAALHRVELGCLSINDNALRLYRRLGFVQDGRDRESVWFDRRWVDMVRFSMLEGEWEALRGVAKQDAKGGE